jgi:beta-lactamase regulating signal transducer with metallopeptidase domain
MTSLPATSLILLCTAATAALAFAVSALAGAGAVAGRRALDALTPAAQARVLLVLAILPAITSIAVMTTALSPTFGWIADHCLRAFELHTHPHICAAHHVATEPALPLMILAALLLGRLVLTVLRLAWQGKRAAAARRALERIASTEAPGEAPGDTRRLRVLPFDEPQAFVLGLWRPLLFVTRGLVSGAHREHLEPVLAHERAHLRRRDSLRRLVSSLALAFHLPGVAGRLERQLVRAHELAADAEAAAAVQSPERVAHALVQLTRVRRRAPASALAFDGADVEARVTSLLDPRPRHDQPQARTIGLVAVIACVLLGAGADLVHHGVEILLGLLSS